MRIFVLLEIDPLVMPYTLDLKPEKRITLVTGILGHVSHKKKNTQIIAK